MIRKVGNTGNKRRKPLPTSTDNQRMVAQWRERLEQAMERKGISQRHAGQLSKLGTTSVRHMLEEATGDARLSSLVALADGLGVSFAWLVTGRHVAQLEGVDDGAPRAARILQIWTAVDYGRDAPIGDDFVAVMAKDFPADARAMEVPDSSMVPEGQNQAPVPESMVAKGDIVIVSPSGRWDTGKLVAAHGPRGILIRLASYRDDGKVDLIATHHLFPKITIDAKRIIGSGGRSYPSNAIGRRCRCALMLKAPERDTHPRHANFDQLDVPRLHTRCVVSMLELESFRLRVRRSRRARHRRSRCPVKGLRLRRRAAWSRSLVRARALDRATRRHRISYRMRRWKCRGSHDTKSSEDVCSFDRYVAHRRGECSTRGV